MTKMNKVLVILSTILRLGVAYSQTPGLVYSKTIDSLKKVLQSEKDDTNKVNMLNELSYIFLANQKSDSALLIASQSLPLSRKLGFKEGEGTAYLRFGYGFQLESKFDEALKYYLRALEIFK